MIHPIIYAFLCGMEVTLQSNAFLDKSCMCKGRIKSVRVCKCMGVKCSCLKLNNITSIVYATINLCSCHTADWIEPANFQLFSAIFLFHLFGCLFCRYRRQAKKQFHYESNQRTCVKTFMQLMVPMRDKIYEALNIEEITNALSQNPENKLALWEDLKLIGFTRAVTSVIATCTLYVFLQVQMNIIAGYMYLEKTEASQEASEVNELIHEIEMDVPISDLQKEYLNNIKFLFNDGIFQMIDHVKAFTNGTIFRCILFT